LRYCNAGHPAPVVIRRDAGTERLLEGGGVLGIFPGDKFDGGEIYLEPGDRLVLFTDGVAEAHNADGDEFGEAGLLRSSSVDGDRSAKRLLADVMSGVDGFSSGELEDDATLLVVSVND
jgi:sigma-B regulation protein RsbU (phosphoserine phosphatase)